MLLSDKTIKLGGPKKGNEQTIKVSTKLFLLDVSTQ